MARETRMGLEHLLTSRDCYYGNCGCTSDQWLTCPGRYFPGGTRRPGRRHEVVGGRNISYCRADGAKVVKESGHVVCRQIDGWHATSTHLCGWITKDAGELVGGIARGNSD